MSKKRAPGHGGGVEDIRSAAVSRAEAVRLWEALFDEDTEAAQVLFMDALLRDAKAEYDRKEDEVDEEEDRLRARVFEPWQLPAPGSVPPPPVTVAPAVKRTTVLGLRAPAHLVPRKHDRTTALPGTDGRLATPTGKKSRAS